MKTVREGAKHGVVRRRRRSGSSSRERVTPDVTTTTDVPVGPRHGDSYSTSAATRHGDSYSDVTREDELVGMPSSHHPHADRRPEEPSDAVLGAPERLEGSTEGERTEEES